MILGGNQVKMNRDVKTVITAVSKVYVGKLVEESKLVQKEQILLMNRNR